MKVMVEVNTVNFNVLNQVLQSFSDTLNNSLLASGNKIQLIDPEEGDFMKHTWRVKASIEWERVPKEIIK